MLIISDKRKINFFKNRREHKNVALADSFKQIIIIQHSRPDLDRIKEEVLDISFVYLCTADCMFDLK